MRILKGLGIIALLIVVAFGALVLGAIGAMYIADIWN